METITKASDTSVFITKQEEPEEVFYSELLTERKRAEQMVKIAQSRLDEINRKISDADKLNVVEKVEDIKEVIK